jgi:hypothetical protein
MSTGVAPARTHGREVDATAADLITPDIAIPGFQITANLPYHFSKARTLVFFQKVRRKVHKGSTGFAQSLGFNGFLPLVNLRQ